MSLRSTWVPLASHTETRENFASTRSLKARRTRGGAVAVADRRAGTDFTSSACDHATAGARMTPESRATTTRWATDTSVLVAVVAGGGGGRRRVPVEAQLLGDREAGAGGRHDPHRRPADRDRDLRRARRDADVRSVVETVAAHHRR